MCHNTIGRFKSYVDALKGLYPQLLYTIDYLSLRSQFFCGFLGLPSNFSSE